MKFSMFITLLIICYSSLLSQEFVENDSIIAWSTKRNLSFDDFQRSSDIDKSKELEYKAETTCKIHFSNIFLNDRKYEFPNVINLFYKKQSLFYEASEELLQHEQLHFDIVELYTRKIRKCFDNIKDDPNTILQDYFSLYEKIFVDCVNLQNVYDTETAHGTSNEHQVAWVEKIKNELDSLKNYEYCVQIEDIE